MSSIWARISYFLTALALVLIPRASAQTSQGTLTGTVTDSSGALVAGARVSALHQATGFSYAR
jgi:hypothetical protein